MARLLRLIAPAAWLAAVLTSPAVQAQDYPSRPIQLVVPFAAGGAIDQMARAVGVALSKQLGQAIVIDNRPGAGGNIGAEMVARSAANGYTLLVGTSATHGVNPSLYAKLPYDAVKDFTPVALWGSVPNVLVVNTASDIRSVADLIAQARQKPGTLTFGSAGNGTSLHLAGELFKQAAGVDLVHVPYKGASPASVDLLAGHIAMMFDTLSVSLPNLKAGKTRALAVTSAQRHFALPGTPTFAELGYPSVVSGTWAGLLAPAGTPPAVIARLESATRAALEDPDVAQTLHTAGVQIDYRDNPGFARYIDAEIRTWGDVIRKGDIRAD